MKILHVQETLSPRYGGPATVLPQLASAQAAAGHDVVVATTNADHPRGAYRQPGWDTLADGAVPVFYARVEFAPLRFSAELTRYLWNTIPDFDIVHVHGLYRFPPTIAAFLSRRYGVPLIIRPHGSLDPFLYRRSTSGKLRLKRLYERLLDRANLDEADAVHYTAEDERERASFLKLRSPSFIIPNGLEWERYETLPKRGNLRSHWGVGDAPLVLFLGRVHVKKGLDLLVPAFDTVRRIRPDAHLIIAGPENDSYGRVIRALVSDRGLEEAVHFVGPLQRTDVIQAYVDADVFALPSYTENFGMTVVEAMACALPVVISDQVNIHAEISAATAGLVTRCDVDELAAGLLSLLDDPQRRSTMGDSGRRLAREKYSWPTIVQSLAEEYEVVLQRRGSINSESSEITRHWRNPVNQYGDRLRKLISIVRVRAWRRVLIQQHIAAAVEHTDVLRDMVGLRTIVDVGANRGQFALAARHCFPEAHIVAFEPLARPAERWRAAFADDPRATLVEAAVGPTVGDAPMHVSGRDDSSSLLPITATQNVLFPGTAEVERNTVRVTRLAEHLSDTGIQSPALLKIDVQGFELQALSGCDELLERFDWVYVECSFIELYAGQALADEVIAWLRSRGFILTGVHNLHYEGNGRAIQGDFIFARKKEPDP